MSYTFFSASDCASYPSSSSGMSRREAFQNISGRQTRNPTPSVSSDDHANYGAGAPRPRGGGACNSGRCGAGTTITTTKPLVKTFVRKGEGFTQANLRFSDPKTGQSVKPPEAVFTGLRDRDYRPKRNQGSTKEKPDYVWRRQGNTTEVSPNTVKFLQESNEVVWYHK